MVKIEKTRVEDVSDVQSIESVVYNATNQHYKTVVKFLGIPIWTTIEKVNVTIPEIKDKKYTKVGFKKE
jgi:hypothetical protein